MVFLLPTGIDNVWIDLIELGKGAEADDAVFTLQPDIDVLGDEIAGQHRQAYAQVYVHAILEKYNMRALLECDHVWCRCYSL